MIPTLETFLFQKEITGSSSAPLKFICADSNNKFRIYFIKYILSENTFDYLVYEIVCSQIAQNLAIKTPDIALVHVLKNSFNDQELTRNKHFFEPGILAFGSKNVSATNLLGKHHKILDKYTFNLYANPFDLIKIAIFDLLVDNRDRAEENFNLLKSNIAPIEIYAFDHYYCFGGRHHIGEFHPDLFVNVGNTILRSEFCEQMFQFVTLGQLKEAFANYWQQYFSNIGYLIETVNEVFDYLPSYWQFSEGLQDRMKEFISNQKRIETIKEEISKFLPYLKT